MDKKQWTTRKIVKNIDANKERGKAWFFIVVPCPSKPHPHPPTHPLTHCLPVGVRCSLFASCRCQSRWLRCMSCCRCCDEECICNLSPSCHAHDHGCVCVVLVSQITVVFVFLIASYWLCCSCTPHKHSTKKAEQLKKSGKPARKPSIFAHRLFRIPCPQCPGLFSRRKLAEKGLDLLMMCFLTASHFAFLRQAG